MKTGIYIIFVFIQMCLTLGSNGEEKRQRTISLQGAVGGLIIGKRNGLAVSTRSGPEKNVDDQGCRMNKLGLDYIGTVSVTRNGRKCQAWSAQTPHRHNMIAHDKDVLKDKNYCRNPDKTPGGPWCYTLDKKQRWEFCDIPYCGSSSSRLINLEKEVGTLKSVLTDIKRELDGLRKTSNNPQNSIFSKISKMEGNWHNVSNHFDTIEKVIQEHNKGSSSRLVNLEKKIGTIGSFLTDMEKEVDGVRKASNNSEKSVFTKIREMEEDWHKVSNRFDKIEKVIGQHKKGSSSKLVNMKKNMDSLDSFMKEMKKKFESLRTAFNDSEKSISTDISQIEGDWKKASNRFARIEKVIEEHKKGSKLRIAGLEKHVGSLDSYFTSMRKELSSQRKDSLSLKNSVSARVSKMESDWRDYSNRVNKIEKGMKEQNSGSSSRLSNLEKHSRSLDSYLKNTKKELDVLRLASKASENSASAELRKVRHEVKKNLKFLDGLSKNMKTFSAEVNKLKKGYNLDDLTVMVKAAIMKNEGYIGCFKDDGSRLLKTYTANQGSLGKCKKICKEYKYLGLQAGSQCFCGNTLSNSQYPMLNDSECPLKCTAEPKRMCGGYWRNAIYLV